MKDRKAPEAVQARAEQKDPIVMYLIVRKSLNMGVGKTAAQCAHGSQMLTSKYFDLKDEMRLNMENGETIYPSLNRQISIFGEWMASSFRKVVLSSNDKNWEKIKSEFKDQDMILVIDAGLTEIAAGSETVIGLWPMRKNQAPKSIRRLQILK